MFFSFRNISHWPQWLAGLIVSLSVLVTGLANGWTSPLLAQLTAPNNTLPLKLTAAEASWFASLLNVGRLSGAILGAIAQEHIGRKQTLLWGAVPLAAGWTCIIIGATSVPWLYAARLLCGLASGTIWSGLSLFVGEIADPKIRGSLIFLNLNVTAMGTFLGIVMGPYVSMETFSYVSLAGTGLFVGLFSLVPDSPYHHIANGNLVEAERSLKWFKRDADVKVEVRELQDFVGSTNVSYARRFQEFRRNPEHVKNLLMLLALNVFLYCSGHNTMSYYAEIIVTQSTVDVTPSTVVIALGFSSIIAGSTAVLVVDKFGRRSLLIASATVTSFSLILLGAHFHMLSIGYDVATITWLPIFALLVFNFGSYYGIVPVPSALVSELFPPIIKTLVSMTFSSTSSVMAFVVSKGFQPYVDLIGEKYVFWSFAFSAMASAVFVYFVVPETKGKSLVEIQESMNKKDHHATPDSTGDATGTKVQVTVGG